MCRDYDILFIVGSQCPVGVDPFPPLQVCFVLSFDVWILGWFSLSKIFFPSLFITQDIEYDQHRVYWNLGNIY